MIWLICLAVRPPLLLSLPALPLPLLLLRDTTSVIGRSRPPSFTGKFYTLLTPRTPSIPISAIGKSLTYQVSLQLFDSRLESCKCVSNEIKNLFVDQIMTRSLSLLPL